MAHPAIDARGCWPALRAEVQVQLGPDRVRRSAQHRSRSCVNASCSSLKALLSQTHRGPACAGPVIPPEGGSYMKQA